MFITLHELIKMSACKEGVERFIAQTGANDHEPVNVLSLIGGKNTVSDLLWLAGRKLPNDKIARFACDCALLNIEKIKPHTDKYDLVVGFLQNPTPDATYAATRAAAEAVRATYAATRAAAEAARAAAEAAEVARVAYAAETAEVATLAALEAARAAAEAAPCNQQVNELLKGLFS